MKKLLTGLFLITSLIAVADEPFDYVEDKLELKYSIITDAKKNSLNIEEIEVGVFGDKIYTKLEIESFAGDGGWGKFDKASYDQIATKIADDIRGMLNSSEKVEISLILEKEIGQDELLHNGLF